MSLLLRRRSQKLKWNEQFSHYRYDKCDHHEFQTALQYEKGIDDFPVILNIKRLLNGFYCLEQAKSPFKMENMVLLLQM